MTPDPDDAPDARLGDLLTRALPPGPAPDLERLAALRAATLAAFADAPPTSLRRTKPMTHLLRVAAGLIAAGVALFAVWPESPGSNPVRRAVEEVARGEYHFRLTEVDRTLDIFNRGPDRMRVEESADRYTLVDGDAAYAVDEAANRYTPLPASERDRLRASVWDAARSAVVGSEPRGGGGRTYALDPPAEIDLDAAGRFVELRRYAVVNGLRHLAATLTLLGNPAPGPDDKFALKATLSEDGRVGKVTDVQGLASIKPPNAARFTPLRPNTLVLPGDWVQVDPRGANAATVRLLPEATVVVGPGGLVEVTKPAQLRLLQGEIEVTPTKGTPIELVGPDGVKLTLAERGFYRLTNDKIARVTTDPVWLKSLKGASVNESLGSLVAQVDGRAVSLSVGVHQVTVEVRDQIARTTIEETFVNHTNSTLEGVFHFPLPQDASIAGFAMWIGNEKVEADVVEKKRAREIFETILREKRDPGLLEWAGGNLFKARVFPIFAHSEKRVAITYTQVLRAVGNKVRYSYALQSEMLRVNPLKELSVTFTVTSALPLKSVTSPTHLCRGSFAGTSAKLEFAAREYTPTKDFEAVVELSDQAPAVTLVPHRRGSDGYFLLQVTPPAPPQAGRELVASDKPLSVVLWCDTSASIDAGQRRTQAAMAGALLTALTPADTFNLAVTDVETLFAFDKPTAATPANVGKARDFLAKRASLGWSDLERGLAAVLAQAAPGTHVVYLGDGVAGTVAADPQAAAVRLEEAYKLAAKPVTVHAVALGSTFESGVMVKLASLGGGSSRRVNGEQGPVAVALEILGEVTRPPVRNVKVSFTGLKTARVYPDVLPNLTPGTQQILLGRYLPEGADQKGEVVVTGTQAGREVRFAAPVTLKDAEAGNSFLPRLWARLHLDKLLEGPQTPAVKDDVIGLSEEFHIMTPYTSFLVLESDADRARFAVKRRFEMRDGEQFFADGRNQAAYALQREQMKAAGLWRAGLRRNVLNRLANLDRPPLAVGRSADLDYNEVEQAGGYGGSGGDLDYFQGRQRGADAMKAFSESGPMLVSAPLKSAAADVNEFGDLDEQSKPGSGEGRKRLEQIERNLPSGVVMNDLPGDPKLEAELNALPRLEMMSDQLVKRRGGLADGFDMESLDDGGNRFTGRSAGGSRGGRGLAAAKKAHNFGWMGRPSPPRAGSPLDALFPHLPPVPADKPRKSPWPQDVTDLATLVHRGPTLAGLPGGLTIQRTGHTAQSKSTELVSPKRWAARHESDASATVVDWCDGPTRVMLNAAFHLARRRDAKPADLAHPAVNGYDATMTPLWQHYGGTARIDAAGPLPVIVITSADGRHVVRVTIDPAKKVVTQTVSSYEGAPAVTVTIYADFVPARGQWWPTVIETATAGKVQSRVTQTITETADDAFAQAFDALTAPLAKCVVQKLPFPTLAAAKQALATGKATTDDRFALARQAFAFQRYEEASAELDAIDKLEAGKPALAWLRIALQMTGRRNEEARQRMLAAAPGVLALPTPGDRIALAQWLTGQAASILSYPEQRELRDKFTALFNGLPVTHGTRRGWVTQYYYGLVNAGFAVEAFAYLKARVAEDPANFDQRHLYLRLLFDRGERDAAYAGLREQITAKDAWSKHEVAHFYAMTAEFQEREGKLPAKLETLAAWQAFAPDDEAAAWQFLSALVRTDADARADGMVHQWLAEAKVARPTPAQLAKARAAIRHVTGQADRLPTDRLDPKWAAVLADAARFFFAHDVRHGLAELITRNNLFQPTDAGLALHLELFERVVATAGQSPLPRLLADLQWATSTTTATEPARWVKLATAVRARWAAVADEEAKHALGHQLAQLLRQHVSRDESLSFTRERIKAAPAKYRRAYQGELFSELVGHGWNEAHAAETYDLLPAFLLDADDKPAPAGEAIGRLFQVNDWAMQARNAVLQGDIKNPERLTRPELKAKREEALRQARGELIDRLMKLEAAYPAPLKPWAKLERLTLQARHDADPNAVAAELFALLGAAPVAPPTEDAEVEVTPEQALALELQARAVGLAMHAVTRRAAKPETVARLRQFLDAGVAQQPKVDGWKQAKYELLIALDLPQELEATLAAWAKAGDPTAQWRTALGHLLAELGRLKEAIATFEGIQEIDAAAYGRSMALARLYMAVDDKAKHEAARADAYRQLDEHTLARLLQAKYAPWQPRQGVALPTELDADTLPILAALVEKLTTVDNYFHTVQSLYQASKDFRIPATVADAILGQTAGKVYNVVLRMQSLLNDIRDEASADTVFGRIEALRAKAKTPTDQRALDLLAMQIHRRAAEVKNQPGPHAEQALAAFRRAFDRPWVAGEKLLMARLLRDFGTITPDALGAEQMRQLQVLTDDAPKGTLERLNIAECLAAALHNRGRTVEALAALTPVLAEYLAAVQGVFTQGAMPAATLLSNFHEARKDYAAAERLWFGWRSAAANEPLKVTIGQQLDQLYDHALQNDGEVTLGRGAALYAALLGRLNERLRNSEPNERHQTLNAYANLFQTAGNKQFARRKADVLVLATETFPRLVRPWEASYANHVQFVAGLVHTHLGPVEAVEFVVTRIEGLPAWLRRGGWNQHASALGGWRYEPPGLPPALEARLLTILLAELTDDLRSRQSCGRALYDRRHSYYWSTKEAEFAAAAEAVLAEAKDSVPTQMHIADYLFRGCNRTGRAIDILSALHRAKKLDVAGRGTLSHYLLDVRRYAEAVDILVPLVEDTPDDTTPRFRLMDAYAALGKPAELRELFSKSIARWKERGAWTIQTMPAFGDAAQRCDMHHEAAGVYAELIPNAQRAYGSPNGELAEFYRRHAESLSKIGRHVEAVDAASGAIVAWGGDANRRQAAIATLNATAAGAANLEALVAHFDKQTAETGLVNPILRKALGQAYMARQNYGPAVPQLELAVEAQPNDPETFTLLIGCYDKLNLKAEAIARILKALDLTRRDLVRYDDLGKRYAAAGDPASAERSVTSIVEVTRGDAEGQALLAVLRQREERWEDAILHWEQVDAVRSLEPEGLVGLANAQLHLKRYDAAKATIQKLRAKTWPTHTTNVPAKLQELEAKLPKQ